MNRLMYIALFVLGTTLLAQSQKLVKKNLDVRDKKVEMKFSFADTIFIQTWDKKAIDLQVSVNIDDNRYNDDYDLKTDNDGPIVKLLEEIDFKAIQKKKGENKNYKSHIVYRLKIPANLEFDLNTISGKVEMKGPLGKISVSTVSGFIDYTIPSQQKVKIDLSTVTGNIYSDVKFDEKPVKDISWIGTNRKLTINGGNVPIELKTVSGDIYLRKGR